MASPCPHFYLNLNPRSPGCQPRNSQTKGHVRHQRAGPHEAPVTPSPAPQAPRTAPAQRLPESTLPAAPAELTPNSKPFRPALHREQFPAAQPEEGPRDQGHPGPEASTCACRAAVFWAARPEAATATWQDTLGPCPLIPLCGQNQGPWGSNSSMRSASPRARPSPYGEVDFAQPKVTGLPSQRRAAPNASAHVTQP